jgi:hypothetical protein
MYVNQIDEMFDNILNNFNEFLDKNKVFEKIKIDINFVIYQLDILKYIDTFIKSLSANDILVIIKNKNNYEIIINMIKRYCAYYIFLGLAYHYAGNRDLYITNIIEISRYQKDAIIQIPDFFNSDNNSKLVIYYNDIKNILSLLQTKTIDKIKILLNNNIVKYESTNRLFIELGDDYIIDYFLVPNNFHNIIKTIIFRQIYIKEDRTNTMTILNNIEKESAEYIFIDVVVPTKKKIVDINIIQNFLNPTQLKSGLAEDIYSYLEEYKSIDSNNFDIINYMFNKKIIIPITEEFMRFHKDTEKYDIDDTNKDNTKIKYITNKMNSVINYYSPLLSKNPKLKLDTEKLFFKPLEARKAVLYNNIEDSKLILKLGFTQNASDIDLLIDLLNLKKYAYVNFKNSIFNVLKMRPTNTISCIRNTNISYKPKEPLELRIGNSNIDINIIGIALNPLMKSLNCFNVKDLVNINPNKENGFKIFVKTLLKSFNNDKYDKLYYWIFNKETDTPNFKTYVDYGTSNDTHNITLMLNEIFNYYVEIITNYINDKLNKFNELNSWYFDKILTYYKNKLFDFDINNTIKNNIIQNISLNKIKEYEVILEDDYKHRQNIIKLPSLNIKSTKANIIALRETIISIDVLQFANLPLCHHYIKWSDIHKISRKSDEFNQAIFNFVKKYVKTNESGDYICKSCNENVPLQKFVVEGTYIEELDIFQTTSIGYSQRLEEIPKYQKYIKSIRNIDKNIEKFCYSIDLVSYLGNTPIPRLKRRMITKDIIDLILIHTQWLKTQPKNRMELYQKKYGINSQLTNLFFFDFKDEIFLTSSLDTDYYKIIKYNNIIAYMIVIIISEINVGQIINFKNDKKYNYLFFTKISDNLFNGLYLRLGQKEKILITKIPLLSYVIYYFSGILISYNIWLFNDKTLTDKTITDKTLYYINLQKTIIHTIIDLLNSLFEANLEINNKNYLYEVINTRLNIKISYTFNDNTILQKISEKFNKTISYDEINKKLQFINKKIDYIDITNNSFEHITNIKPICDLDTLIINQKSIYKINNNLNIFTNCDNGSFHNWVFNNELVCSLCNKTYNDLVSSNKTLIKTKNNDTTYLDKLKMINLKNLSLKYCITGELHSFDSSGICTNCGLYNNKINLSQNDLLKLEKNINNKLNELSIININNTKKIKSKLIEENNKIIKNINDLNKSFDNIKIISYITEFINKITNILGNKIKIKDTVSYLNDTMYIINHDYLGTPLKDNIIILSSDNKMIIKHDHPSFNFSIMYYKFKNIYVYYDLITLQYIGYSDDNKIIKKTKNNAVLTVELSLKDCLLYLGYENQYYNLYHVNHEFINQTKFILNDNEIITYLIRNRINNLRQIITRTQSIIFNIKFRYINKSVISNEEKDIINEGTSRIKKIKTDNLFVNKNIINKINMDNNIPNIKLQLSKHYIDLMHIINIVNTDTKILFYYINNLSILLDNNNEIITELAYIIIKIIKYLFNFYYRPYNNYNIRKFDYQLINETPYIDETLKVIGHYQELMSIEEINNPDRVNEIYDDNEAKDSYDIDEYEPNDDLDDYMEALDGFDPN